MKSDRSLVRTIQFQRNHTKRNLTAQKEHTSTSKAQKALFLGFPAVPCTDPTIRHTCKISRRIKSIYSMNVREHPLTGSPCVIYGGMAPLEGSSHELYSFVAPHDALRGISNAMIFHSALYSPRDVLTAIFVRMCRALEGENTAKPIIPFHYDNEWKIDVYTDFLRPFQWGVPAVSLISLAKALIDSSRSLTRETGLSSYTKRAAIAAALITLVNGFHNEGVMGTPSAVITAEDFARLCYSYGCTLHETIRLAKYAVRDEGESVLQGFSKYVYEACLTLGGSESAQRFAM